MAAAARRSGRRSGAAKLLVLILALLQVAAGATGKQAQPITVERVFKANLAERLRVSLDAAVRHLALAFGLVEVEGEAEQPAAAFGLYELELEDGLWRTGCESSLNYERDKVHLCALHKLTALAALCEAGGNNSEWRQPLRSLLKRLVGPKQEVPVAGLGLKRWKVGNLADRAEVWLSEVEPGSGKFDLNLAIHAAATLAVAQCDLSLGQKDHLDDLRNWLQGLKHVHPQKAWGEQHFHSNGVIWEAAALVADSLPDGSEFAEMARELADHLQAFTAAEVTRLPTAWSFSAARAAALSLRRRGLKPARRKQLAKSAGKFFTRFVEMAPRFGQISGGKGTPQAVADTYTCGPLQGAAPLALALLPPGPRGAPPLTELQVSLILGLATKDMETFQVNATGSSGVSQVAERLRGSGLLSRHSLAGAFLRDAAQLKGENRSSLRVDDTALCVVALARTLELLRALDASEPVVTPPGAGEAAPRRPLGAVSVMAAMGSLLPADAKDSAPATGAAPLGGSAADSGAEAAAREEL